MMQRYGIVIAMFAVLSTSIIIAQSKYEGLGGGIGIGGYLGDTELKNEKIKVAARAFIRYGLVKHIQGDFGIGVGEIGGDDYKTLLVPIDYRFLISPMSSDDWNPYLYAGIGALHYDYKASANYLRDNGWTGVVPVGVGFLASLNEELSFEISGGYNYGLSDKLNNIIVDRTDGYWSFLVGLTTSGENSNGDPDGDGLSNRQEKELGTNPKVADTDGDGLNDGDEVNVHRTSPLNTDSDSDGLHDGDEVKNYKTNPMKADSDSDGLNDGDELMKYKTDPLKADTDADGLNDGDELMKYKTDPLKADTDADSLKDGDEVNRYKTDPLKADTDGGSVNDGMEITNGTSPLEASDDVPKKEELKVEVGESITLEGVVFKSGSAELSPESEDVLAKAFNTLDQHPEIEVEIQGHTDNTGKKAMNMKLSQRRADAVKAFLVNKGINADRILTKGFGPDKPIATNTTTEGKQRNRRIEFFRTK